MIKCAGEGGPCEGEMGECWHMVEGCEVEGVQEGIAVMLDHLRS